MSQESDLDPQDLEFMRRNKIGADGTEGKPEGAKVTSQVTKILETQRLQDRAERAYERLQEAIDEGLASAPAIAEDAAHAKLVTTKVVNQILADSGNSHLAGAAYRRKVVEVTKQVIGEEIARAAKVAGVDAEEKPGNEQASAESGEDLEAANRITQRDQAAGNFPARGSAGSESAAQKGPAEAPKALNFGAQGIGAETPYPTDSELAERHEKRLAAFLTTAK